MTTYLFPGQGSQAKGMGAELFPQFPDLVAKADAILGYSIAQLCLEDPHDQLGQTQYTQPALYVVSALSYFHLQPLADKPRFLIGHSLGEYNALLAAEVFDFETGLRLVKKRGELMSQATDGAMAAVIGLSKEAIVQTLVTHHMKDVSIANENTYAQLVISGDKMQVEQAAPLLKEAGAKLVTLLKTSGAFHSPLMMSAQKSFETFLRDFHFSPSKIPVIANINAQLYDAHNIQANLTRQITHPVRFVESIEYAMTHGENNFLECGPGNVLTKMVKRIENKQ